MARRKISYIDANKALIESQNRREQSRLEAVQKAIDERNEMRSVIENARDARFKKERNHAMLMEAARDDNLSKSLKAIYITALNPNSLTEVNLTYADGMVDNYINAKGGATNILEKVKGNTYFLSRLTQIVEDNAKIDVHNIENFDRDLDKEFDIENIEPKKELQNDVHKMQNEPKTDNGPGAKEGTKHDPYEDNPVKDFSAQDDLKKTNGSVNEGIRISKNRQFANEAALDFICEAMSDEDKYRKNIAKKISKVVGQVMLDNGIEAQIGGFYIGGNNAAFIKGASKTWLMAITDKHKSIAMDSSASGATNAANGNADRDTVDKILKALDSNKAKIKKEIESALKLDIDDVKVSNGKMGVTNLSVTLKEVPGEDGIDEAVAALLEDQSISLDGGNEITISIKVNKSNDSSDSEEDNTDLDDIDGDGESDDLDDEGIDTDDSEFDTDATDSNLDDSADDDLAEADEEADSESKKKDEDAEDLENGEVSSEEEDIDDINGDNSGDLEDVEPDNGEDDAETDFEDSETDEEEGSEESEDESDGEVDTDEGGAEASEEDEEKSEESEDEDESKIDDTDNDEDVNDIVGDDLDDSNLDTDDTIENPGDDHGQLFKDLEDEPDVKKAIEIIRDRISDAEETFIKNNAKDKEKISDLIDKISNNVKTVEDAGKDSKEGKIAQEAAENFDRERKDIQQGRTVMSIFEKITRKLNGSMLKNREVLEAYRDEDTGRFDEGLIIETARVLYGWIETLNTLKLEKVDEVFIEDLIDQI